MSYILDALRRAEAERQRGRVPGLHAPPAAAAAPALPARSPLLLAGMAAGVLVLAAAAGAAWWLGRSTASAPDAAATSARPANTVAAVPAATAPAAAPASTAAPLPAAAPPAAALPAPTMVGATPVTAPVVVVVTPAAPTLPASAAVVMPGAAPAASAPPAHVPTLAELPESIRASLPALTLGGTVYANAPAQRLAVLNGQVFHQGDQPVDGLVVKEIRLRSVVLSWRGQAFELGP